MAASISIGDEAPNFDLSSTEDVLLMLRDEVARMGALLYFFSDPASDSVRSDLEALARSRDDLARKWVVIMGISSAKLPVLKDLQKELQLPFPLLSDDREFAAAYGIEESSEEVTGRPGVFLVGRQQQLVWMSNPCESVERSLPEAIKAAGTLVATTSNTPGKVINRVVNWWVNRVRKPRVVV